MLPDKKLGVIMITNCRTDIWDLTPLSVRALQIAAKCVPATAEPEEKEAGGDE